MSTILRMKGPVCTLKAMQRNAPRHLCRIIKKPLFHQAANALQAANLGTFWTVKTWKREVFVKREPSLIEEDLEKNKDLCTIEDYTARFYSPTPACIKQDMRTLLVEEGLVKKEYFEYTTCTRQLMN